MTHTEILLVDDEPKVTAAMKLALRHEPFEFHTANCAADALDILAQRDIAVVVSDERMPGMPGSVFLREARKLYPNTVRIILSGHASLEDAARAINDGEIYRFLIKPVKAADLVASIRQALQHRERVTQSRKLLREYQKNTALLEQTGLMRKLGSSTGIFKVNMDEQGAVVVNEDDTASVQTLIAEIVQELEHQGLPDSDPGGRREVSTNPTRKNTGRARG